MMYSCPVQVYVILDRDIPLSRTYEITATIQNSITLVFKTAETIVILVTEPL
jgi:hypothetical protein